MRVLKAQSLCDHMGCEVTTATEFSVWMWNKFYDSIYHNTPLFHTTKVPGHIQSLKLIDEGCNTVLPSLNYPLPLGGSDRRVW